MGYLVRWTSKDAGKTELAFSGRRAKEDAIARARAVLEDGARDVELLENGRPLPRQDYAETPGKGGQSRRRKAPA